jgi:hypothetical protein
MSQLNLIPLNQVGFTFNSAFTYTNNTTNNIIINGSLSGDTLTLNKFDGTNITITGFTSSTSGSITGLTSSDVTNALGFIPYDSTNPNLYIDFISGDTRYYLNTNPSNYISSITSNNVTTALGYTPLSSITLTGDVTGSGFNSVVTTLASITTGNTVGSSTQIPVISYDTKGRIISAYTVTVSGGSGLSGITSINNQTGTTQTLVTGNTGNDFNISSIGGVHTFNLPTASSSTTRGLLSSSDFNTFSNKFSYGGNSFNSSAFLGLNDSYQLNIGTNGNTWYSIDDTGNHTLSQDAIENGNPIFLKFNAGTLSNLSSNIETNDIIFNLFRNVQWGSGNINLQRAIRVRNPIYLALSSSTINDAYTFTVDNAPLASTNMSINRPWSFGVLGGNSVFAGSSLFGITGITPSATVHILNQSEQLRVGYNSSQYFNAIVNNSGSTTLNVVGSSPTFNVVMNNTTALTINNSGNTNIIGTLTPSSGIIGNSSGSVANTGIVGERVSQTISTYTNYTTSATYQSIASISGTSGRWRIIGFGTINANGATLTTTANTIFAASFSSSSLSGSVEGLNICYVPQILLSGSLAHSISFSFDVLTASAWTYRLITQSTFTSGNPQFVGSIIGIRLS